MRPDDIVASLGTVPAEVWVGLSGLSLVLALASLLLMPRLLSGLPEDFLVAPPAPLHERWARAAPGRRLLLLLRNFVGAVLFLLGLIMLFVPGQGVLTILAGLAMLDLPGRHRLLVLLLSRPRVASAVGRLRRRAGVPPLRPADPGPRSR